MKPISDVPVSNFPRSRLLLFSVVLPPPFIYSYIPCIDVFIGFLTGTISTMYTLKTLAVSLMDTPDPRMGQNPISNISSWTLGEG